jgi:hypothetical protein
MSIPTFTADATLYRTRAQYRARAQTSDSAHIRRTEITTALRLGGLGLTNAAAQSSYRPALFQKKQPEYWLLHAVCNGAGGDLYIDTTSGYSKCTFPNGCVMECSPTFGSCWWYNCPLVS